jgi:hypothetical protein
MRTKWAAEANQTSYALEKNRSLAGRSWLYESNRVDQSRQSRTFARLRQRTRPSTMPADEQRQGFAETGHGRRGAAMRTQVERRY